MPSIFLVIVYTEKANKKCFLLPQEQLLAGVSLFVSLLDLVCFLLISPFYSLRIGDAFSSGLLAKCECGAHLSTTHFFLLQLYTLLLFLFSILDVCSLDKHVWKEALWLRLETWNTPSGFGTWLYHFLTVAQAADSLLSKEGGTACPCVGMRSVQQSLRYLATGKEEVLCDARAAIRISSVNWLAALLLVLLACTQTSALN